MRLALGSRPSATVILIIATVVAACSTGSTNGSPAVTIPTDAPAPSDTVFEGGRLGYDGGAEVLAYSTALSPLEAAKAYAATLIAEGYVAVGVEGAWQYFLKAGVVVAYEVGASGPPTDLLVRIMALDAVDLDRLDPMVASEAGVAPQTPIPQPDPPNGGNGNATGNAGGNRNAGGNGAGKDASDGS